MDTPPDVFGDRRYVLADEPIEEHQSKGNQKTSPGVLPQRISKFFASHARPNGEDAAVDPHSVSLEELSQNKVAGAPWQILFQAINFPGPEYIGLDILGLAVIGRSDLESGAQPDLDLSPFEAQAHGVSRHHAVLVPTDGELCVIDLDSANGTWLNGKYLHPGRKYRLRSGDTVEFGTLKLMVRVIGVTTRGLSINSTPPARTKPS